MELLKQFGIITALSLLGEILNHIIPLPVPASVWGMVFMFLLLCFKIVKLEQVEKAADFLLSIMTVMFVPVGAGLIQNYTAIKNEIIAIFIILIISTLVCFFITGHVAQFIINLQQKKREENHNV